VGETGPQYRDDWLSYLSNSIVTYLSKYKKILGKPR